MLPAIHAPRAYLSAVLRDSPSFMEKHEGGVNSVLCLTTGYAYDGCRPCTAQQHDNGLMVRRL